MHVFEAGHSLFYEKQPPAMFLRVYKTLTDLQRVQDQSNSAIFIRAFDEHPDVVPVEDLINVHLPNGQKTSDHDPNLKILYTMLQLFEQPQLLSQYGIVILGKDNTSGFGKSSFAKRLAIEYCKAYATQHGIHHSKATVVFASTLDILKDVHWEPGMILVLDEFHPYDTSQLIYVSETIMKQIVCPSEVTNIRARNFDIQIPKHIPRILTGNVPEEVQGLEHSMIQRWYGALVPFSVPLSAVEQTEHSSLP